MALILTIRPPAKEKFGSGLTLAVVLHVALAATLVTAAFVSPFNLDRWGGHESTEGAIQASVIDALPLPPKAAPVDKSVLVQPEVSPAPAPPPKEAAAPPPKPTDVLVKGKTPPPKTAKAEAPTPPKHAQPVPETNKAATGAPATQIPQSIAQTHNGQAALTVQDHVYGQRYAYYFDGVQRKIGENWLGQEADPRASMGKSVKLIFDINRDGTPSNIRVETSSGSPTLDLSAIHALQRIDTFGPLPAGNKQTIEDTFTYHPQ
jgi:protein TonB